MNKKLISLLLLFASACTFQVQMVTPQPSDVQPEVTPSSSSGTQQSTVTANPTEVFAATKSARVTDTVPPPVFSNTTPIHFSPNGTFVDVVDSISGGTSKTYSVSALKGQVMSVSVHQGPEGNWTDVPLQITGTDGAILCISQDTACYFWRGVLPATQDYFITLAPDVDIKNFTLRVAINPPGVANQSFQYVSQHRDVSFTYQDDFAPARFPGYIPYRVDPEFVLRFIDTSFYTHTNLGPVYVLFGSSNDNSIVANCTQPVAPGGMEQVAGEVNINGREFVRIDGFDAAAGTDFGRSAYRAVINGYCYEMMFFYSYGNIGNYAPELGIKEFDRAALLQKFQSILSTMVIK